MKKVKIVVYAMYFILIVSSLTYSVLTFKIQNEIWTGEPFMNPLLFTVLLAVLLLIYIRYEIKRLQGGESPERIITKSKSRRQS